MKNIAYVCLLTGLFLWISCDKDPSPEGMELQVNTTEDSRQKSGWDYNYKLASTTEELSKIMDDQNANIVRSSEDFRRFVRATPSLKQVFSDPLLYRNVISTMKFDKRGLKTFNFKSLRAAYPERYRVILTAIYGGFGV